METHDFRRVWHLRVTSQAYILQDIPRLEIPLHTLIELVPKPDGKMAETRISIDVDSDGPPQVPSELIAARSCMAVVVATYGSFNETYLNVRA